MFEGLYEFVHRLGYGHPLHPPLTHLPLGLIMGAFVFGSLSSLLRHAPLGTTARHCIILALLGLFPTVFFGVADWQYFYQGATLSPVKAKLVLAALLFALLACAVLLGRDSTRTSLGMLALYALCLITSGALGFFGGELLFKRDSTQVHSLSVLAREGVVIFQKDCSGCHFSDSTETKLGPGLRCLFSREKLPVSGEPLTEESVRRQITTPYRIMPSFGSFTPRQMDALIAYLKSL